MPCRVEHLTKSASNSSESRRICEDIMQRIYKETPEYWPHGLSVAGHDDLFLVRSASTDAPMGFVGWQERDKGKQKVGYYTIGILPEYRRNGSARAAVSELIRMKSANVDRVEAYIVPGNTPSEKLAESLQVPVIKSAAVGQAGGKVLSSLAKKWLGVGAGAGALGNAAIWDWMMHPDNAAPFSGDWDRGRAINTGVNAALGAAGPLAGLAGLGAGTAINTGLASLALAPAKDNLINLLPATKRLGNLGAEAEKALSKSKSNLPLIASILGGSALLGGAGLAGAKMLANRKDSFSKGKIQLRLPTKDPNDQETVVELPIGPLGLSDAMVRNIGRDTRRKLRDESKERAWRRGADGKLVTRYTKSDEAGDIIEGEKEDEKLLDKAASTRIPLPLIPRLQHVLNCFSY